MGFGNGLEVIDLAFIEAMFLESHKVRFPLDELALVLSRRSDINRLEGED